MEENIDHPPPKRLKITAEQSSCSTFESLAGELILELFEYFNTKEILQSFFNLTAFINTCIFDRRQQIHLYLDRQMTFFSKDYSPDQIVSLHIKELIIPINIFLNLKSLHIVCDTQKEEEEWVDIIQQILGLSQLVSLTISLFGSHLTKTSHEMIKSIFCHHSLRRIILSKMHPLHIRSPVRSIRRLVKLVYVSKRCGHFQCRLGSEGIRLLKLPYNIRSLDLDFNNWRMFMLEEFLTFLPLLVELKIKGCAQTIHWYFPIIWERMLQNLKALQRVSIDIDNCYPAEKPESRLRRFNDSVAQEFDICKRINLTLAISNENRRRGWFHITASLNMNEIINKT